MNFDVSLPLFALATVIPVYVGLFLAVLPRSDKGVYLAALSVGILIWYMSDVLNDAALLDVNHGFSGGLHQALLVGLFTFALALVCVLEKAGSGGGGVPYGLTVPLVVAVAIQLHGVGEGIDFGAFAASTQSDNILQALGGYGSGVAYMLHKALEAFVIGAAYEVYAPAGSRRLVRDMLILGGVASIPGILGDIIGNFVQVETTFFFAMGAGAALYVIARLGQSAFSGKGRSSIVLTSLAVGFFAMYCAGLLHAYAPF